jgi:hypothetical protein
LTEIVKNVDQNPTEFDHLGFWQIASPVAFVDVAANRGHRRNCGEFFENLRRANIAGVHNVGGPSQRFEGLRAKQTVRVGNDTNQNGQSQSSALSAGY